MASDDERPPVKLRSAMATDVGIVRDHNEDAAYVDEGHAFFVVADGMGGHAAGEVASAMAVESVKSALDDARDEIRAFGDTPTDDGRQKLVAVLEGAVREAHRAVYERGAAEPDKQGMGTTLDVVLVAGPEAFVAHVGDSRTYLMREGKAAQITTDHTVAEVLVIEGKLTPEEATVSPLRTILVNAIGVAPEVGVEMAHVRLRQGDRLLLCSDGLHDYFPTELEIAERTIENDPEDVLAELIDLAKERGGHDNITGVLVEVLEAPALTEDEEDAAAELHGTTAIPQEIARDDTLPVDIGQVPRRAAADDDDDLDDELDDEAADDAAPAASPGDTDTDAGDTDSRATLKIRIEPDGSLDAEPTVPTGKASKPEPGDASSDED